jgi:hypothetical protein
MSEPESKVYFVNIYEPGIIGASGSVYKTRELADQMAGRGRVACKEIYVAPGEGLQEKPE